MNHTIRLLASLLSVLAVTANDARWSKWTDWTRCSRSCGVGVSFQTRRCLNSTGSFAAGCVGNKRQNSLCNIQDCPAEDKDFRSIQCAAYNSKKYNGKYFKWVPVKRGPFTCELTCMPKGQRFFVKFVDKVADGTQCTEGSLDVCIDGKCEKVGCDLRLNSTAKFDKCRECNGRNGKCKLVKGIFELKKFEADYIEMLHIPARTTTITIKEEGNLNNYIALKNYKGDYILNGDWTINNPGKYKLNGHYATYKRSRKEHSLKIDGPIHAPLTIETLALQGPVRFSYEYYVPNELGNGIPKTTYRWEIKERGECSASCAGGVRKIKIVCVASNDDRTVSGLLCNADERPIDVEDCNLEPCPAHWFVGEWTSCSTSCGVGEKVRRVHCVREVRNGQIEMLSSSYCKGEEPVKNEKCSVKKVCPEWKPDSWSECSKSCGSGFRIRQVKCVGVSNFVSYTLEAANCDLTIKPILREPCNLGSCNLTWVIGSWSQCSAHCGSGMKNRQITCQNSKGRVYPDGYCDKIFKPHAVEDCIVAGPCQPMWYATQWSKCSRDCGYGIQIRMVYCAEKIEGSLRILKSTNCKKDLQPLKMRKCHKLKPCISQYFASSWKPCSVSCGTGLRFRKVRCYADTRIDYSEATCKALKKPASVELCNRHSCSAKNLETEARLIRTTSKAEPRITTEVTKLSTKKAIATTMKTVELTTTRSTTIRTTQPTTLKPTAQITTKKPEEKSIPAIIINFQGPDSIDEGSTVDYYCNAMGVPTPQLTWTLNGKPMDELSERFLILNGNSHLVITDVTKGDIGQLKCLSTNKGGSDSKSLNIKVTSAPAVVVTPTIATLTEGNSFFMTCEATAYPAAKVSWHKDGRRFYGDSKRVSVTDTIVRFKNLVPADSGTYECRGENYVGYDRKSMSLTVQPAAPAVVVTPTIATLTEGNSFFMTCEATAYPAAKVSWHKDGRRFYGDSKRVSVTDTIVRFKNLVPADSGTYECRGENYVGFDRKSMSLTVQPDQEKNSCVDDPDRANCVIIKQFSLCSHEFYAAACCKTCTSK